MSAEQADRDQAELADRLRKMLDGIQDCFDQGGALCPECRSTLTMMMEWKRDPVKGIRAGWAAELDEMWARSS